MRRPGRRGTVEGMRENALALGARKPPGRAAMPAENRFTIAAGAVALVAGIVVLAAASGTGGDDRGRDAARDRGGSRSSRWSS